MHLPSVDRDDILALVRCHFVGTPRDAATIQVEGPIRAGRGSRIFRAVVPGLPTPLVVKCLLDPATGEPDRKAARVQFDALDRVHRAMASSDLACRTPVPYFLDERHAIVAAEWVDGRPMTAVLLSRELTAVQGRDLFRRAAAWIRHFYALRPLPGAPLDVPSILETIGSMERAELSGIKCAHAAFAALRKHADAAGAIPLERSWLHGDFKTDNLLVDGASMVGIDVHARFENPVAHDLASFVNHWELTLSDPRAWRWWPHRKEFTREFLDAFDPAYRGERRLAFAWIALFEMLGLWEGFTRRRQRNLRHVYLAACFRHIVRRMTRELADAARKPLR